MACTTNFLFFFPIFTMQFWTQSESLQVDRICLLFLPRYRDRKKISFPPGFSSLYVSFVLALARAACLGLQLDLQCHEWSFPVTSSDLLGMCCQGLRACFPSAATVLPGACGMKGKIFTNHCQTSENKFALCFHTNIATSPPLNHAY